MTGPVSSNYLLKFAHMDNSCHFALSLVFGNFTDIFLYGITVERLHKTGYVAERGKSLQVLTICVFSNPVNQQKEDDLLLNLCEQRLGRAYNRRPLVLVVSDPKRPSRCRSPFRQCDQTALRRLL